MQISISVHIIYIHIYIYNILLCRKDSNRRRKYQRYSKDTPSQIEGLRLRIFFFPFLLTILASDWGEHCPHAGSIYRCFSEFWLMLDGARLLNQIEDTIVFPLKCRKNEETHRRYLPDGWLVVAATHFFLAIFQR